MSKLEHDFFGKNQNPSLPKAYQKKEKKDAVNGDVKNGQDRLRLNFNIVDDEESWYDLLLFQSFFILFRKNSLSLSLSLLLIAMII